MSLLDDTTKELLDGRLSELENGTTVFKLDGPITFAGVEVSELKFPPPKGKHLKAMDKEEGGIAQMLAVASAMTSYPQSFFDELSSAEVLGISATIGMLLGKRRSVGGT